MSEEYKITAGTISGATLKSIDIEPSIIVDGKSYTASEFNEAVEMLKQPQLNENQQIVLEWLKACAERFTFSVMYPIFHLGDYDRRVLEGPRQIDRAFSELNFRQEAQVLQAYSQWALEQEAK